MRSQGYWVGSYQKNASKLLSHDVDIATSSERDLARAAPSAAGTRRHLRSPHRVCVIRAMMTGGKTAARDELETQFQAATEGLHAATVTPIAQLTPVAPS